MTAELHAMILPTVLGFGTSLRRVKLQLFCSIASRVTTEEDLLASIASPKIFDTVVYLFEIRTAYLRDHLPFVIGTSLL